MNELDYQMTKALTIANGCLLRALVDTHPDQELLQKAFRCYADQMIGQLNSSTLPDERNAIIKMQLDLIDTYFPIVEK